MALGESAADIVALIVEDDPYFLNVFKLQLNQLGIEKVSVADNGARALQRLQSGPSPNLILCDLQMPTMNGIDFLRQLYFESYSGGIVIISGEHAAILESAKELISGYGLNLLGCLSKPVKLEELSAVLSTADAPEPGASAEADSATPCFEPDAAGEIFAQEQFDVAFEPVLNLSSKLPVAALARPCLQGQDPVVFAASGATRKLNHDAQQLHRLLHQFYPLALQLATATPQFHSAWGLAVELPVSLLVSPARLDQLINQVMQAGFKPEQLHIHLAGTIAALDFEILLQATSHLTLKGVSLWAAGHDRGLRELERVLRLPLKGLCVDPVLLQRAAANSSAATFLNQHVALGHARGLLVAAAGVESQAQHDVCKQAGCDLAFGSAVSPGLSADTFAGWAAWHGSQAQTSKSR